MKNYFLIIDGSALLCTQFYGTKELKSLSGEPTNGIYGFMRVLEKTIKEHKPSHLAVCWDISRNTFRKDLFSGYKETRSETPDLLKRQFILCQELLNKMNVKQFFSNEFEADDYAGSLSKKFEKEIDVKIITKDADYFQLISEKTHILKICTSKSFENLIDKYSLNKKDLPNNLFEIDKDMLFNEYGYYPENVVMLKTLMGDSSDNIPGVYGVGEKTALIIAPKFKNISEFFDLIEGKDEKELNEIKKDLGISKNIFKSILGENPYGLKPRELGLLSEKLVNINRDIPIEENLEDLVLKLDFDEAKKALLELDIKTLFVGEKK